jgi:hypothetical protein
MNSHHVFRRLAHGRRVESQHTFRNQSLQVDGVTMRYRDFGRAWSRLQNSTRHGHNLLGGESPAALPVSGGTL